MKVFLIAVLILLASETRAALPHLKRVVKLPEERRVGLSLDEKITNRLNSNGHYPGNPPFRFVSEHEWVGLTFARALFGEPVPWFQWNEKEAIDRFLTIAMGKMAINATMLAANPRITTVEWRGMTRMTIVAQITFVPDYAVP